MSKILFGPVGSRRLGRSLGVDLVPYKTCSYDCVYCQLGETTDKTTRREVYISTAGVEDEIRAFLSGNTGFDVVSLAGSGEPTLAANCGNVIKSIKKLTDKPVAVLTNSSLLWREDVREELMDADIILPSVDAVSEQVFHNINRPHTDLDIGKILEGIRIFSRRYRGKILLEILFLQGYNDSWEEVNNLFEYLQTIRVDRVQLNRVQRPATDRFVRSPDEQFYREVSRLFFSKFPVDVVGVSPAVKETPKNLEENDDLKDKILDFLSRRPANVEDLSAGMGVSDQRVKKALGELLEKNLASSIDTASGKFYRIKREIT